MTNPPSQSDRPAESRPGPSSTPSDDTAHRDALRILLDRACRGALLVDEAELLRQHVETELAAGDKARRRGDIWKAKAIEIEAHRDRIAAEADADSKQLAEVDARCDRYAAAIARVRALRERARTEAPMAQGPTWRGLDEALDGPQCCGGGPRGNCPCMHPTDVTAAAVDAPQHGGPIGWQDPNA